MVETLLKISKGLKLSLRYDFAKSSRKLDGVTMGAWGGLQRHASCAACQPDVISLAECLTRG